jgi:hypothetical protein
MADEKPMCFGTYVGEGDTLCSKCSGTLKDECIKETNKK